MPGAAKIPRRGAVNVEGASVPQAETPRVATRIDPIGWDLNGTDPYWDLRGLDPEKHYVWANEDSRAAFGGVDFYEARGYELEVYRGKTEGVQPAVGRFKEGGEIKRNGLVLMSINAALKDRYEGRAQAAHNARMAHMLDTEKHDIRDTLRGLPGNRGERYMSLRRTEIRDEGPMLARH